MHNELSDTENQITSQELTLNIGNTHQADFSLNSEGYSNQTTNLNSSTEGYSMPTWTINGSAYLSTARENTRYAMNTAYNCVNSTYNTASSHVNNFINDPRDFIYNLRRDCLMFAGAVAVVAGLGIVLITSFTVVSNTAWIHNDTSQYQLITGYGPNIGIYNTHVSTLIWLNHFNLNVTLNGYNSYANVYLSNNCQIHISQYGKHAVLKNCPSDWEIKEQKLFIYLFASHFNLGINPNYSKNNSAHSAIVEQAEMDMTSNKNDYQLIEVPKDTKEEEEEEDDHQVVLRGSSKNNQNRLFYTQVIRAIDENIDNQTNTLK